MRSLEWLLFTTLEMESSHKPVRGGGEGRGGEGKCGGGGNGGMDLRGREGKGRWKGWEILVGLGGRWLQGTCRDGHPLEYGVAADGSTV